MKTYLILYLRFLIAGRAVCATRRASAQTAATGSRLARRASSTRGSRPEEDGNIWAQRELRPTFGGKSCRVCPARPGLSRLVPRCPTLDFFWEYAGRSNAEFGDFGELSRAVRSAEWEGRHEFRELSRSRCQRTATKPAPNVGESGADPDCFSQRTPRARRGAWEKSGTRVERVPAMRAEMRSSQSRLKVRESTRADPTAE